MNLTVEKNCHLRVSKLRLFTFKMRKWVLLHPRSRIIIQKLIQFLIFLTEKRFEHLAGKLWHKLVLILLGIVIVTRKFSSEAFSQESLKAPLYLVRVLFEFIVAEHQ